MQKKRRRPSRRTLFWAWPEHLSDQSSGYRLVALFPERRHADMVCVRLSRLTPRKQALATDLPFLTMRAHQFLYYVKCAPVLSDYEYDAFCKKHGLDGGGGSDRASDYTPAEIAHAVNLANLRRSG